MPWTAACQTPLSMRFSRQEYWGGLPFPSSGDISNPRIKLVPRWNSGKESACQCRRCGFYPWVGKIPWRRKWQHTPVFLPGKSHGERHPVSYSPWGHQRVRQYLATKQQQKKNRSFTAQGPNNMLRI